MSGPALEIAGLSVRFGRRSILHDVSLSVAAGGATGLVGESGCGKTTLALAVLRGLPPQAEIAGRISVAGQRLDPLDRAALRRLRARQIAFVFQDPVRALNPALRIGRQLAESFRLLGQTAQEGRRESLALLARLRIAEPERLLRAYPHEISGGQAQRVGLAMAFAKRPALLVLDEPTTGLDPDATASMLDLVAGLRSERGTALLLISHDLAAVGRSCDRIGVLYAGTLVEEGPASALLARPRHPYTSALARCAPRGSARRRGPLPTIEGGLPDPAEPPPGCRFTPRCPFAKRDCRAGALPAATRLDHVVLCNHPDQAWPDPPGGLPASAPREDVVLSAEKLSVRRQGRVIAGPLSLRLRAGETLGVSGRSGSGKSSLLRSLLGLLPPAAGTLNLAGSPLAPDWRQRRRAELAAIQPVFQNPDEALNRALTVRAILLRPLRRLAGLSRAEAARRLRPILDQVRLDPALLDRHPRSLSGGQRQRVAIAHALASGPRVLLCDEPTTALDLSVQAAILNLLVELRDRDGLAILLVSHDSGVIGFLCDHEIHIGGTQ